MLNELWRAAPALKTAFADEQLVLAESWQWRALAQLMRAHAPSGGAGLPGGIADDIDALVTGIGLADRYLPRIGSTGNAGIWLGADKQNVDLVIAAHMDRPSFRVSEIAGGTLYPICANRFPAQRLETPGKALRFERERMIVGARGMIVSERADGTETLRFRISEGELRWQDTITIEAEPVLNDGEIRGTGLDNALGVLVALGAAALLRAAEDDLIARNRRLLIVFTDQEEGNPAAFFGHGAARLAHAIEPPTVGVIVVDAQTALPDGAIALGAGAAHGAISSWGRGSIVPPNAVALALDLSEAINRARPGTVQINNGYISRSDDLALSRWTQILALIGPPMRDAHTAYESAALADISSTIWWLVNYTGAALALAPELARRYALFW
jgi:putative aminopeptidase FrvX